MVVNYCFLPDAFFVLALSSVRRAPAISFPSTYTIRPGTTSHSLLPNHVSDRLA